MRDLAGEDTTSLIEPRPAARRANPWRHARRLIVAGMAVLALVAGLRYGVPRDATAHPTTAGVYHVTLKGPGVLDARRMATLGTTVRGRLEEIGVDTGDWVAHGEIIARLEDDDARNELDRAMHQAQAARLAVYEAAAQLKYEEAIRERTNRELVRQQELQVRGVVADGALDIARADDHAAEARVAEARVRIERLIADFNGAKRQIAIQQEAVRQTVVMAPFKGLIVGRDHEAGDVVSPGDEVLRLVDTRSLVLTARFDESLMARVALGQPAFVTFHSEPDRRYPAHLDRINREVDEETREFTIDLRLDDVPANWALGQRGTAEIRVASIDDALSIPVAAIERRDGGVGVWALENGRARWQALSLGPATDGMVQVRAGLEPGAQVLTGDRLFEAMRVRVPS